MLRDDLQPHELMQHVAQWFESQNVDYWVVGSMASMAYGEPRFTNDVDMLPTCEPNTSNRYCLHFQRATFIYQSQPYATPY